MLQSVEAVSLSLSPNHLVYLSQRFKYIVCICNACITYICIHEVLILYNTCIPHSPPVSTIWLTPSVSIVSYPFNWVVCHVVVHWFNLYVLFVFVILLCVCNGARTVVYTQLTGCSGYISCCTSVIGLPSLRCDAAGRSAPHANCFVFDVVMPFSSPVWIHSDTKTNKSEIRGFRHHLQVLCIGTRFNILHTNSNSFFFVAESLNIIHFSRFWTKEEVRGSKELPFSWSFQNIYETFWTWLMPAIVYIGPWSIMWRNWKRVLCTIKKQTWGSLRHQRCQV